MYKNRFERLLRTYGALEKSIKLLNINIDELKKYPGGNIQKQGQDPKDNRFIRAMIPKWQAEARRPPIGSSQDLATQGTWWPV
jgi:hypothetical protein